MLWFSRKGSDRLGYRLTCRPWSVYLFILRWFSDKCKHPLFFNIYFLWALFWSLFCVFFEWETITNVVPQENAHFLHPIKKIENHHILMSACRSMPCFSLPQGFCQSVFCGWEVWNIKILKTKVTHRLTRPDNQMRALKQKNQWWAPISPNYDLNIFKPVPHQRASLHSGGWCAGVVCARLAPPNSCLRVPAGGRGQHPKPGDGGGLRRPTPREDAAHLGRPEGLRNGSGHFSNVFPGIRFGIHTTATRRKRFPRYLDTVDRLLPQQP